MANNKDNPKTGAKGSMSNTPDREFKGQGPDSKFGQGQQAGGSQKGTNPNFNTEYERLAPREPLEI